MKKLIENNKPEEGREESLAGNRRRVGGHTMESDIEPANTQAAHT